MKNFLYLLLLSFTISSQSWAINGDILWVEVIRTLNGVSQTDGLDPSNTSIPEVFMDQGSSLQVRIWSDVTGSSPYTYAIWGFTTGYYNSASSSAANYTFNLSAVGQGAQKYTAFVDNDEFDFRVSIQQIANLNCIPEIQNIYINGSSVSSGSTIDVVLNNLNETFEIKLKGKNIGTNDSPSGYNNLTLAFPQFNSSNDLSNVTLDQSSSSSDLDLIKAYGTVGGGDQYAQYVICEATDVGASGWEAGENNYFYLDVSPKLAGSFIIEYRMGIGTDASYSNYEFDPSSGYCSSCGVSSQNSNSTIDPFGFYAIIL